MNSNTRSSIFTFLIIALYTIPGLSQPYPDTNWVSVTYFDFHSDLSCPDFNPCVGHNKATKFMTKPYLDADGLPEIWAKSFFSYYLANWFRSSEANEQPVTDKKPVYDKATGAFMSEQTVGQNPYVNIKIQDSLPFVHIGNGTTIPLGTYEYLNKSFFPLDDRGFGIEPTWNAHQSMQLNNHNYSFSMMLVDTFTYRKGLTFRFSGDDDVWVFINNRLVLDLGGIHSAVTDSFELDPMASAIGLQLGRSYELRFFFAERQATQSNIWITSNIISVMPNQLNIKVYPGDTIHAGDTLLANAIILSDTGEISLSDLPGDIEAWGFIDLFANNHDSTFSWKKDSAVFIPTEAHTTVRIWATYKDTTGLILTDTVDIVVLPGPPDHLVIEASPDKPPQGDPNLWNDNPLDQVLISEGQNFNEDFYAILRDKYDNWIGPAYPIKEWRSDNPGLITAEAGSNPQLGQGRANRAGIKNGEALVFGDYEAGTKILSDDIKVILTGAQYKVLTATYYETDDRPDGLIDLINIVVEDTNIITETALDSLFKTITLPAWRQFSFSRPDMTANPNGFTIKVTQVPGSSPYTTVDANKDILAIDNTKIPGGLIIQADLAIQDSLAPVITAATYCPQQDLHNNDILDTLVVTFSEQVKVPFSKEPFEFYDISQVLGTYLMTLAPLSSGNADIHSFLIEKSEKPIPQNNDSIWIIGGTHVADYRSQFQEKDTKPVPLQVKPYPVALEIKVLSPITLSNLGLHPNLVSIYKLNNDEGTVVVVHIYGTVDLKQWSGSMRLFDAVGNTIRNNIIADPVTYFDKEGTKCNVLVFFWDASNSHKRLVGPGSYMGTVEVKRDAEIIKEHTIYIGVTP